MVDEGSAEMEGAGAGEDGLGSPSVGLKSGCMNAGATAGGEPLQGWDSGQGLGFGLEVGSASGAVAEAGCWLPKRAALVSASVTVVGGAAVVEVEAAPRNQQGGQPPAQDWVDDFVNASWPYMKRAFERLAWESIPGILEASRPSWVHDIRLDKFELGQVPPTVNNIRVHSSSSPIDNEIYFEFDFFWKSEQDVRIEIVVPRLPLLVSELIPNAMEEQLKLLLRLTVSLSKLSLKGSARMSLRPVWDRLPLFGALQVALVQPPEVGYELSLGPMLAALMPLVKTWLDGAIKEMVFQPYTLPEHYFFQLDPEAKDVDTPSGVLVVKVLGADKVPKMDVFGWSDPFVELYVRDTQRHTTAIKRHSRSPTWDETFTLPVHLPEHQELTLILWDNDEWSANDEFGRKTVQIKDLRPGQQQALTLKIRSREEEKHKEEKQKRGGWQRVAMAAGRPFTKQSSSACQLRLQVLYHPFSEQELQLVAYSRQYGRHAAFNSPQAGQLDPHVRQVLLSGMLVLNLLRAEDLTLNTGLRLPFVKVQIRVGEKERSSDGVQASSAGSVEFQTPVVIHLGPEESQDVHAIVRIELQQDGWLGPRGRGRITFRLQEVLAAGKLEGEYHLGYVKSGKAHLSLEWKPYL
ncbi:hypothetical protein N2152v2_003126 [Parachlorella kessleri]